MCGIAGIVGLNPAEQIGPMLESIEHRGRDDHGQWLSEPMDETGRQVCFGHRRLSIIDTTSGGHEPMFSHDDRFVLTFNGEIYNYRELREQLTGLGSSFHTDSDAEVLLESFARWGLDSLPRLNGMFAFAIWDKHERTLTLARDHVGIKPLYYAHIPKTGALLFASEIKAILASKLVKPEIDPQR
jgi:asparagine synthase (glutamine-hydrolysing)